MQAITVLLLAGQRPNPGPICEAYKTVSKSIVPVAGKPMIQHPLASLAASRHVARIIVIAQQPDVIREALTDFPGAGKLVYHRGTEGISRSVLDCIRVYDLKMPVLVTTADNCLLRVEDIDDFVTRAAIDSVDLVVGLAEKQRLVLKYPSIRRTWIPFRDISVSGCNLFLFNSARCLALVAFWARYESSPKKHFHLAWTLGPGLFWQYLRRQASLDEAFKRVSVITGINIIPLLLVNPAVSIDADKITDVIQIEALLKKVPGAATAGPVRRDMETVVIFDLDRTITRNGTYTPFLLYYAFTRQRWRLLCAPLVVLCMLGYLAGLFDRKRLKTQMFRLLAGEPDAGTLRRACEEYVGSAIDNDVYPDALYTIRAWRDKGARTVLATASYDWLANIFAQRLGFDHVVATRSIVRGGRVLPGIDGENCYGASKRRMVEDVIGPSIASGGEIWFYTDHHSDIPLLDICTQPVAINATPRLANWISTRPAGMALRWRSGNRHRRLQQLLTTGGGLCMLLMLSVVVLNIVRHEISLGEIPPHILSAINRENPQLQITEASIETEDSSVVYELEGTSSGTEYEIDVTEDGTILSIREDRYLYQKIMNFMG